RYLLAKWPSLPVPGVDRMAKPAAGGIELMRVALGGPGAVLIGIMVAVATLTSINATIFTGARTNYALGRDVKAFAALSRWNPRTSAPTTALLVQSGIALALIVLGAFTRDGFQSMVDFTAPVFWFFFLSTGISLFV